MKYGLWEIRTTEHMDNQLREFCSKCLRGISYRRSDLITQHPLQYDSRIKNVELRTKHCVPQIYSQIHREVKYVIYRWRTTMSMASLNNNKSEFRNELRIWEYDWGGAGGKMQEIITKVGNKMI